MKLKPTLSRLALLLTMALSSAAAHADTVTLTLGNANQAISAQQGGTLTFSATASAPIGNGAAVNLNGDAFNIDTPLTLDDTAFFVNFPFFLNPGAAFTGGLFTVNIPAHTALGVYAGSFTLQGGADGSSLDTLDTVSYKITVTPEPSTFLLLGTGMTGVVAVLRKKRSTMV